MTAIGADAIRSALRCGRATRKLSVAAFESNGRALLSVARSRYGAGGTRLTGDGG